MGQYEWLVLTCRACRRLIKLPPAMAGKHVICPHCRTKISVPKDAPVIQEAAAKSQIPTSRQNDEATAGGLGGVQDWEVGQRQVGGDLEFRSRLHSTADPEMQPDPDKEMRRVNMRRRKMEQIDPDFDSVEVERRKKRRRSVRSSSAFGDTLIKGLIIAVILLVAVVGWLGWEKWRQPRPAAATAPKAVQKGTQLTPGADGKPRLEAREFSEYAPALAGVVRKFVACRTVDEMLPFVRDRARVEPKMRAYYTEANPVRPVEISNTFTPDEAPAVDDEFLVLDLKLPNGDTMPLTVERSGSSFLVDWESYTGYCEMSWDELRKTRPKDPVLMRVVIERSVRTEYWDGAFSDHTSLHCFLLRDLKSQHFLSGYTVKDSEVDKKLMTALKPAPPPANELLRCMAVIRVSYPPDTASPQQVHISEFLESGWVFRPGN